MKLAVAALERIQHQLVGRTVARLSPLLCSRRLHRAQRQDALEQKAEFAETFGLHNIALTRRRVSWIRERAFDAGARSSRISAAPRVGRGVRWPGTSGFAHSFYSQTGPIRSDRPAFVAVLRSPALPSTLCVWGLSRLVSRFSSLPLGLLGPALSHFLPRDSRGLWTKRDHTRARPVRSSSIPMIQHERKQKLAGPTGQRRAEISGFAGFDYFYFARARPPPGVPGRKKLQAELSLALRALLQVSAVPTPRPRSFLRRHAAIIHHSAESGSSAVTIALGELQFTHEYSAVVQPMCGHGGQCVRESREVLAYRARFWPRANGDRGFQPRSRCHFEVDGVDDDGPLSCCASSCTFFSFIPLMPPLSSSHQATSGAVWPGLLQAGL